MPAGVTDKGRPAVRAGRLHRAGISKTGLLLDRQRIELGAHQHGRPGAVSEHCDDARLADMLGDGEAQLAHPCREQRGGAVFLEGELGMGVEIFVEALEVRIGLRQTGLDLRLGGRHVERGGGQRGAGRRQSGGEKQQSLGHDTPPDTARRQ